MSTAVRAQKRVFPLHLTPFERYMWNDDRLNHPMTFVVQIEFQGDLRVPLFRDAVAQAAARHPLITAGIAPAKRNIDCWVRGDFEIPVDIADEECPIEFERERLDLRSEAGARIWVRHSSRGGVITAQFHHATCDGIGSYQFLGDVLWFYAHGCDDVTQYGPLEPLPELKATDLRRRLSATFQERYFRSETGGWRTDWRESAKLAFAPVRRMKPGRGNGGRRAFPGIVTHDFDKRWYRAFRRAAQREALTSNDLLLEQLFRSLCEWNGSGGPYVLMVPLDLRETARWQIPAANIVSYGFLRARMQAPDADDLRQTLREGMAHLKQTRHATGFMNILIGSLKYPRLFRVGLAMPKCIATATLSNTGDPSRQFFVDFPKDGDCVVCGNLHIEDFAGVPPMRPGTRLAISVFTYRRRLRICLRCDPNSYGPDESEQFLQLYSGRLDALVADTT